MVAISVSHPLLPALTFDNFPSETRERFSRLVFVTKSCTLRHLKPNFYIRHAEVFIKQLNKCRSAPSRIPPGVVKCSSLLSEGGVLGGVRRFKEGCEKLLKRKSDPAQRLAEKLIYCAAVSTDGNVCDPPAEQAVALSRQSDAAVATEANITEQAAGPKGVGLGSRGREEAQATLTVSVVSSMTAIPAEAWDACALSAAGPGAANPFLAHAFLLSLEESRSACTDEGWLPQHLVARGEGGEVLGVVPLYLKSHSYGEYVFDHSWASAYTRFGRPYYPKLQSCVPFTPATGPRLLVKEGPLREAVFDGLCQAMKQLAQQFKVSSLHVTFPTKGDWERMAAQGFMQRIGMQYHWENRNYTKFDDFLMDLKQGKRKNIRQERKKVAAQGLVLKRLRGDDIKSHHWDAFYSYYRNTTDNKWGQAYLTREFFHMIGERMGDQVLLVMAEHEGAPVAGALNLIGGDTLFGRNWGCEPRTNFAFLHFEACYYQAIEAAIEWGLQRVEAGAQGEHKIQRGYLPTPTYSTHYIANDEFRPAVADFLKREAFQVALTLKYLDDDANPFKEGVIKKPEN